MKKKIFDKLGMISFLKNSPAAPVFFIEIIIGVFFSVLSLKLFDEIAEEVLSYETHIFDVALSHFAYSMRSPLLTDIMVYISYFGADVILISGAIIVIFLAWKKHKHEAILFVFMLGIGAILNIILKVLYQRPRPDLAPLLDLSTSYSFPSGHSMNAFIFYSILSYFVFHFTRKRRLSIIVSIIAIIVILLVGFSRVYLGVHYPSDVIAGFIAGFFVFVMAIVIDRTMVLRRLITTKKNDLS